MTRISALEFTNIVDTAGDEFEDIVGDRSRSICAFLRKIVQC